jgi:hypothetical protein
LCRDATDYDQDRAVALGQAIAGLGHDGIIAFNRSEPEYECFHTVVDEGHDRDTLFLLAICSGVLDYQLPEGLDAHDY